MQFFPSRLLLLLTIILNTYMAAAQTNVQQKCADEQLRALLMQITPGYENAEVRQNQVTKEYINQMLRGKIKPTTFNASGNTPDGGYIIPVVVHIIYPAGEAYGTGTNISYAQIRSQIEALNAAFSKSYPGYNGQSHPGYAANAHVRFCLARNTGDTVSWATGPGGVEFGVKRYADNSGAYNHEITPASATQLLNITNSSGRFPFNKYLNIWLVKTIGGGNNIMGYAPRPIMSAYPLDGVVIRADIFGDNTTGGNYPLNFGLTQGKILVHELGHYFNLYHIFQGGCAGANAAGAVTDACDMNGDMICDIEPAITQNISCFATIPNTCTANYATGTTTLDMINDYMSYADDDCMNTFTTDQSLRMWAILNLERFNLWQPQNLAATGVLGTGGCVPPYLNAQINTNDAVFCAGKPITFSNPMAGNTATTWLWQLAGADVPVANTNTVTVKYNTAGNYKAILKVSDGTNNRKDTLLFSVLDCKLDSSMLYMTHWYFGNFGSVDFTSGAPVQTNTVLTNNTMQAEATYTAQQPGWIAGTVSLSDSLGNLLFYSNAVSIWNKNHQKISTAPIFGETDINASSGVCYVPYPNHPGKYFIAGASSNLFVSPEGVKFAEVDINSNTVQPFKTFQHPSLPLKMSQFLTVVPHCNGIDYWIIAHGYGDDIRFYSFLVTSAGIDNLQAPFISQSLHKAYQGSGNQLKANGKGDKLVLCTPHGIGNTAAALYDFDNSTGEIKNERIVPDIAGYSNIQTGTSFSPDGEYFYLMRSTNFQTNGLPYWLFQYRVSDLQYNIIDAPGFYFAASFQSGPDKQIYITTQEHLFARISDPDKWNGASVIRSVIDFRKMNDNIRPGVSIPGFIEAKRPIPLYPDFSFNAVNCNTFLFTTKCFDAYTATWNFGDASPLQTGNSISHTYLLPGNYTVIMKLSLGVVSFGSVSKTITVLPLSGNISGPDTVCTNGNHASQYYSQQFRGVNYKWTVSNGTISGPDNFSYVDIVWPSIAISGTINLQISRNGCNLSYLKTVVLSEGPVFNWQLRDSMCIFDSSIVLSATPAGGIFTGKGVRGNRFYPAIARAGNHQISYNYSNGATCFGQIVKGIKVSKCDDTLINTNICNKLLMSIKFYPNIVSRTLQFKSPYILKDVVVYNAMGQRMLAGKLSNNQLKLPVLASGLYSVLIYCNLSMTYRIFNFWVN